MDDWKGRRRSLAWLALIPGAAAVCAVLASFGALQNGQPFLGDATVFGAIGGVVIGGGLGVYSTVYAWRSDSRLVRVRQRHPGAVVVNAADLSATGTALGAMFGTRPLGGRSYTVAFAVDGMHVYAGHAVAPVVDVPWTAVVRVHEELVRELMKSQQAVVIGVRLGAGAIGLPWGISGVGRPATPAVVARTRSAIEAVRADALSGARTVVGATTGATGEEGRPPAASTSAWPFRHELRPRLSSKALGHLAAVPGILSGVVVVGAVAVRFGTDALSGASGYLLPVITIAVMSLLSVGLLAVSNLVAKREVAAGYTLSRLGPIEVDQVDSKTGYVVRRAGHPQLSKTQEVAETARVRLLDGR